MMHTNDAFLATALSQTHLDEPTILSFSVGLVTHKVVGLNLGRSTFR